MTKVLKKQYRSKTVNIHALGLRRKYTDEESKKLKELKKQLDEVILDYLKQTYSDFYNRSKSVNIRLLKYNNRGTYINNTKVQISGYYSRTLSYKKVNDFPVECMIEKVIDIPKKVTDSIVSKILEIENIDWKKRDYGINRSTMRMSLLQVYNLPQDNLFKEACKYYKLDENEILEDENTQVKLKEAKKKTDISNRILMKIINHGNI